MVLKSWQSAILLNWCGLGFSKCVRLARLLRDNKLHAKRFCFIQIKAPERSAFSGAKLKFPQAARGARSNLRK
jgi:hypothetical protein